MVMDKHIRPTRKKPPFPIHDPLREYLARFDRERELPVTYERLRGFSGSAPLLDRDGNDTLWESVIYRPEETSALRRDLIRIYTILKAEWDFGGQDHLYVDRIDFCTFGNSQPFRIRIVNSLNDNSDYYYVKKADASRVYGLELEHLLAPSRISFFTCGYTLVEEHIAGIPGDVFIDKWLSNNNLRPIRLAKELVKFNERTFIRLLGDMRSYNYVLDLTPDFEGIQITIRAMDFDQQSYSGRKNFYLPQFFKENNELVFFCQNHLTLTTAQQYQREEQAAIYRRTQNEGVQRRLKPLVEAMRTDRIAPHENVVSLREALVEHYGDSAFQHCERMGDILITSFEHLGRTIHDPHAGRAMDYLLGS